MTQIATLDTARPLTAKQQSFVAEYLVDLNATQASIRAGYSENTAAAIGSENLTKPEIALAIQEAQAERSERTQITSDRVLEELGRIAFASISDAVEWGPDGTTVKPSTELSADVLAAVGEVTETRHKDGTVTTRVRMHDKQVALQKIADHLGMFKRELQVTSQSLNIDVALDGMTVEELKALSALGAEARAIKVAVLGDGS
jgi:phage terminase small subunit